MKNINMKINVMKKIVVNPSSNSDSTMPPVSAYKHAKVSTCYFQTASDLIDTNIVKLAAKVFNSQYFQWSVPFPKH